MGKLQYWMDRLSGCSTYDEKLLARAREIYAPTASLTQLNKPACWRRAARVTQNPIRNSLR